METMTWLTDAVSVASSVVAFAKANPEIWLPAMAAVIFGLTKSAIRAVRAGSR